MADPNRVLFESVVRLLGPVLDDLVFVGGCTTGLFITDPAAADVRTSIAAEVGALLDHRDFLDALSGFLPPDAASQRRRPVLEARLRAHDPIWWTV